jgi:hypothetical protein
VKTFLLLPDRLSPFGYRPLNEYPRRLPKNSSHDLGGPWQVSPADLEAGRIWSHILTLWPFGRPVEPCPMALQAGRPHYNLIHGATMSFDSYVR